MVPIVLDEDHVGGAYRAAEAVAGWPLDSPSALADLSQAFETDPALATLGEEIRSSLQADDIAVLRKVPVDSDAAVLGLFTTAAVPCRFGNGGADRETLVYTVAPRDGQTVDLSETTREFPAHTDSTFLREPHHYVGLCCIEADADAGGDTTIVRRHALVSELAEAAGEPIVTALSEPVFPFYLRDPLYGTSIQLAPILEESGSGGRVRYRADVVSTLLAAFGSSCSDLHRKALDAMTDTLGSMQPTIETRLRPGDYVIFDNRHVLHGRTSITAGARRVVRRLKGFAREGASYRVVT